MDRFWNWVGGVLASLIVGEIIYGAAFGHKLYWLTPILVIFGVLGAWVCGLGVYFVYLNLKYGSRALRRAQRRQSERLNLYIRGQYPGWGWNRRYKSLTLGFDRYPGGRKLKAVEWLWYTWGADIWIGPVPLIKLEVAIFIALEVLRWHR